MTQKGILYKAGETWLVEFFNSSEGPEGTTMHWGTLPVLPIQADHLEKIYESKNQNKILFTVVDIPREQHGENMWVQKYAHVITELDTKELSWDKVWIRWELERGSWDGFWEFKKWMEKNFEIKNKS
jgi:hypothetical protein